MGMPPPNMLSIALQNVIIGTSFAVFASASFIEIVSLPIPVPSAMEELATVSVESVPMDELASVFQQQFL